ncbi:MAG TPA: TIGR02588 family protein [Anaerolineae bacterium]
MSQKRERTLAEWITLGISLAIVLILVGLITYEYFGRGNRPAVIEVRPRLESLTQAAGAYYLPVEIANEGDQTAASVWVEFTLFREDGSQESARIQVEFLAGGATEEGVLIFRQNPAEGRLAHTVSFLKP